MRTLRMAFVGGFAGALMASNMATLQAAPLPTNVATMKSMVGDSAIQVRWGGWRGGGWGHRGFGGWGYRGRGWGAGAFAGALIGGAIASSAYGYYGGGPYYGGYYPVGPYYGGYSYYPVDYSWEAIQEPGTASFYRPYGYGGRPWGYW
ncbi:MULTISPECIES: hypothetical protein [Bradyrhizobium]|uniref:Sulfur globule protein n=1 Tax=Bradyrhizobium valentinum TaxID=1518501 RepID=A0A0R3LUE8_9BRAD|nr:hypothetical protein CP49_39320 [Bradyrhizobium valentinum]